MSSDVRNTKYIIIKRRQPQIYWATKVPLDSGGSGLLDIGVGSVVLGTAIGTFSSEASFLTTVGTLKILVHFKNLYRTERQLIHKKKRHVSKEQKEY